MVTPTRRDRADAIRFLSVDAVQQANSGHPGMPMGMADIAETLWHDFFRHHPQNPHWINRDRFVLSNGHGAMLHYALLHLTGYDLSIEDIKQFRQLHSKTPGHPEVGITPGIETTTGPLGQGLANAVGMAMAEKHLAAVFNRPSFPVINHYTYCFVGDGCLMEGISHEVCSLAGVFGLGKLIVFYDDNGISIDGQVQNWFRDNTPLRFQAYGWHVISDVDGHDGEAIHRAILEAQAETARPTLICCKTMIGWGSPNLAGSAATHGAALGDKEVSAARTHLNWPHNPFVIPPAIYTSWNAREKGARLEQEWNTLFGHYQERYPELANELRRCLEGRLPNAWQEKVQACLVRMNEEKRACATRKASQYCLDEFAPFLPEMMGGSADLTESNCTNWQGMTLFSADQPQGRYIHYGVREFGMAAIMNGMALHGGIIPFGGTFLTFSDYARNAIRLSALMRQRVIYILTHDSIGLGEDGPTHQPIEHLPSLRLIPDLSVWRPCDVMETAAAWRAALERQGPSCLLLSRQVLPFQERTIHQINCIQRGGYVLLDTPENPDAILIATGSEIVLAIEAAQQLKKQEIFVRVVSMPSMNVFLSQEEVYRHEVLLPSIHARVAVEAAVGDDWYKFVGPCGRIVGVNRFGASAPAKDVFRDCGLTTDHVIAAVKESIVAAANIAHHIHPSGMASSSCMTI